MEIYINQKIFEICKKEIRLFKSKCLDEDYDLFKNNNQDDFNMLFLQAMCIKGKNMKILKNKLLNHNIEEKYINDLFYTIIKHEYKYDKGLFSWNEIEEWNVDLDHIQKTSTKYTLI